MINLNDSKYIPGKVSKEELLELYSDYDIFRHYIGDFELSQTYRSPIRRGDSTPSFNIFYSRRYNCLLFKDFGGKRGDCVKFVQELLSIPKYQDAINRILLDMKIHHSGESKLEKKQLPESKEEYDLKIVARAWIDKDIDYWKQYGISLSILKLFNVVPIEGFYQNDHYTKTGDIAYAYLEYKDDKLTFKIYRPLATKSKKWRNSNPYGVHQGYRQLPATSELLIITKSLKDVMSIYENMDIPSIGVQSETCFIKESVVDEYKFRFDRVITLFDNDRQGRIQAESYEKMYDIPAIFIPDEYGVKDFSDLVKSTGKRNAINVLKKLL